MSKNDHQPEHNKQGYLWCILIGSCLLLEGSFVYGVEPGKLSKALSMLHQTRALTESIKEEPWRALALNSLSLRYASAEDGDRAIKIARIIKDEKERESTIKNIGKTLANQHQLVTVKELANSLHSQKYREEMYLYIAGAQTKAGSIDAAIETTQSIQDGRLKDRGFKAIALAQTKTGNLDDALQTTRHIRPEWQHFALEDMALSLLEQGDRKAAWRIVSSIKGSYGRSQAIYALVRAFLTNGDIQEASRMIYHIPRQKEQNQALSAIAWQQTQEKSLQAALKTAARINDADEYEDSLAGIVRVLAQTGKIQKGLELAISIKKRVFREKAFEGIIYEYARQGKVEVALKNLKTFGFTSYTQERLLPRIAMTAARAGHIQKGLNLTRDMSPGFNRNNNLMNIAVIQAEQSDIAGAQKTIDQMIPSEHAEMDTLIKVGTAQFISFALTKNGGEKEALTWVNRQSNTLNRIMGLLGIVDGLLLQETQHETS